MTREDIKHIVRAIKNYRQVNISWFTKDDDFIAEQLETRFIDKPDLVITTSSAPEGLEEAADNHIRKVIDAAGHPGWDWTTQDIAGAFIAGAEYQRKQDQQLIELAEDHAMLAGMNKMKENMMEKAVETEVVFRVTGHGLLPAITFLVDDSHKEGDKVKVIVIPEEK